MRTRIIKFVLRFLVALGLYELVALIFSRGITRLPGHEGRVRILALNSFRNMVDLVPLATHPDVTVFTLDVKYHDALIALCIHREIEDGRKLKYTPEEERRIRTFLLKLLPKLYARFGINVLTSPNFYYRRDYYLVEASNAIGVATVSMFKEAFYADYYPEAKTKQFSRTGNKWLYTLVANEHAKRIAELSHASASERVIPCGIMRMDALLGYQAEASQKPRTAVLFSFTHTVGLDMTTDPRWVSKCFFLESKEEGFVRLFDDVHATFVRTALENPGHRFIIKLLWEEPFLRFIKEACASQGLDLESIPNLTVTTKDPIARIKEADLIIGSGSAVLLEGIAADKPLLFPLFTGAEYNDHYYKYLPLNDKLAEDDLARSPKEFQERIEDVLNERVAYRGREKYRDILERYLGAVEPTAVERHVAVYRRAVEELKSIQAH